MHRHIHRLLTGFSHTQGLAAHCSFQDKAAVSTHAAIERAHGWRAITIKDFPVAEKPSACPVNSFVRPTMFRI